MWTKPGYQPARRPAPEVEPRGRVVAAIPRGRPDGNGDHPEEFRISLDEYKGHPYVSLRSFVRGSDGVTWFPTKKGCSVRLTEAEDVAAAILEAARLADEPGAGRVASASARAGDGPPWEG